MDLISNAINYSKMSTKYSNECSHFDNLWNILISNKFKLITYVIRIFFMSSNIFRKIRNYFWNYSIKPRKISLYIKVNIGPTFYWLIKFIVSFMLEIWSLFKSLLSISSIIPLMSDNVISLFALCFILIFDLMLLIKCSHGLSHGE